MQIDLSLIQCSGCGRWYKHTVLVSYTVYGDEEYWSDGQSGNLWEGRSHLPFTKCGECGRFFWNDDAPQVSQWEVNEYADTGEAEPSRREWLKSIIAQNPKGRREGTDNKWDPTNFLYIDEDTSYIDDLVDAIRLIGKTQEQELFLRTELWKAINDIMRSHWNPSRYIWHELWHGRPFNPIRPFRRASRERKKAYEVYTGYGGLRIENIEKLIEIHSTKPDLSEDTNAELAELYRESKQFGKARRIIATAQKQGETRNSKFWRKTAWKVLCKNSQVFRVR